ncbi:hypothetical protein ACHAXA_002527 [Cyclostephanos tholiformis]|uniref:Uncharacterized protein n=1 Tax=Cyclostephanos tholiformis TaxID=382380 RepID=A0ABD3RBJ4_9STRA
MLFFKKAIVKEVMPPVPPTVFAASVTFIRDVASTACSFIPTTVVIAATDTKVAAARLLEALASSIPKSTAEAKVAAYEYARDVASSIEFNVPDSLKSMIGGHVAGILIFLMLMFTAVLFVLVTQTSTTDDSHQISKASTKVDDEGSSTAPFSSGSSSGSSLDEESTQDEDDAYRYDNEVVHINSTPSMIPSPEKLPGIATLQDVTTAELDNLDAGDTTPGCVDEDDDLSDLSVTPSFEELIRVDTNDHTTTDLLDHVTPKTPDRDWKRERPAEANTPITNPASVSGSSDNDYGISASKYASFTPTRRDSSSSSKMSPLRRGLSSTKMISMKNLSSPLRVSTRKLVSK